MQAPPIATGTLLQGRYRIIGVAGQGQFGQTYLARDQKRLNELCVLKEFIPIARDPAILQSLQQQFAQGAGVLYDLRHGQVPSYQFMVYEDQRFYWVREYIEGKSYGVLLDERKAQGHNFSESEVVDFLKLTLPVLHFLHSQTVIHRNISLDSLIFRQKDQMPVLINFGLVTELVAHLKLHPVDQDSEVYGRWGFAPPEQLQSGMVFPSSDLYALAMTAIALLSGKEPEALYHPVDRVIDWEPWVAASPALLQILRRMLHPDPQRRFASATEVLQTLQRLPVATAPVAAPKPTPSATGSDFAAGVAAMAAAQVAASSASIADPSSTAGEPMPPVTPPPAPVESTVRTPQPVTTQSIPAQSIPAQTGRSQSEPGWTITPQPIPAQTVNSLGNMANAVPQAILTKSAAVPANAPSPARPKPAGDRRIDLASLILLLGFVTLSLVVSWRVFSFLKTQQENTAPPIAAEASGSGGSTVPEANSPPATTAQPASPKPSPTSRSNQPDAQQAMVRRRNLGIDYRFLADFVDEVFYAKYPQRRGQKLDNSPGQAAMRQEWMAIANTVMDKLETLSPALRRKLGTYKPVNYQAWLLDLGETGKSSPTLDALADKRLVELFPDLQGKPLNPKTNGQVWYALAEAQLPQAKKSTPTARP
jgi:serine/threonine protein kinase, bacterial